MGKHKGKKKPVTISGPPPSTPPPSRGRTVAAPTQELSEDPLRAEADAIFNAADTANGSDGQLSKSELKSFLKTRPELKQRLGVTSWSAFFQDLDTDGDGKHSREEWASFYVQRIQANGSAEPQHNGSQARREQALRDLYSRVVGAGEEVGSEGVMAVCSVQHRLSGTEEPWTEHQNAVVMTRIGADSGGRVSLEDFVWYFNTTLPQADSEFDLLINTLIRELPEGHNGAVECAESSALERVGAEEEAQDEGPAVGEQEAEAAQAEGHDTELQEASPELAQPSMPEPDSPSDLPPIAAFELQLDELQEDSQQDHEAQCTAVLSPVPPEPHQGASPETALSPGTMQAAERDVTSFVTQLEQQAVRGEQQRMAAMQGLLSPGSPEAPAGPLAEFRSPQEPHTEQEGATVQAAALRVELDAALEQLAASGAKLAMAETEVGSQGRRVVELQDHCGEMQAEKESLVEELAQREREWEEKALEAQRDAETFIQATNELEMERDAALSEAIGLQERCSSLEEDMARLKSEHITREEHTRVKYETLMKDRAAVQAQLNECITDATQAQDAEQRSIMSQQREWATERDRLVQANSAASVALRELVDERRQMSHQLSELKNQLRQASKLDGALRASQQQLTQAAECEHSLRGELAEVQEQLMNKEAELQELKQSTEKLLNERNLALSTKLSSASARAEAALQRQLDLQEEKRRLSLQLQRVRQSDERSTAGWRGMSSASAGSGLDAVVSMMSGGVSSVDHELMSLRMQLVEESTARKAAQEALEHAEDQLQQVLRNQSSLGTPQIRGPPGCNSSSLNQGNLDAMREATVPAAPKQVRAIGRALSRDGDDDASLHSWGEEVALECVSLPGMPGYQ